MELHLYDSGLLTIPFEYCVTRDTSREMLITDIPETKEDISIKEMDEIEVIKKDKKDKIDKIDFNVYISCVFEQNERTYVFNESKNTFNLTLFKQNAVISSLLILFFGFIGSKSPIINFYNFSKLILINTFNCIYLKFIKI